MRLLLSISERSGQLDGHRMVRPQEGATATFGYWTLRPDLIYDTVRAKRGMLNLNYLFRGQDRETPPDRRADNKADWYKVRAYIAAIEEHGNIHMVPLPMCLRDPMARQCVPFEGEHRCWAVWLAGYDEMPCAEYDLKKLLLIEAPNPNRSSKQRLLKLAWQSFHPY